MKKRSVEQKQNKQMALEKESNLTLVSTTVAIVSFFLTLYLHNAVTVNFMKAAGFLSIIEIILLCISAVLAVVAIVKKKSFLWEYIVVGLVLCLGYYFLENGVSGIPGLVKEADGVFTMSKAAEFLSKIINTQTVIYSLWAFNVMYCVFAIVFHSVKYSKIKKG